VQTDGSRKTSIALFLIDQPILIGLAKMPGMILPRLQVLPEKHRAGENKYHFPANVWVYAKEEP
jgi:hypothetical protein